MSEKSTGIVSQIPTFLSLGLNQKSLKLLFDFYLENRGDLESGNWSPFLIITSTVYLNVLEPSNLTLALLLDISGVQIWRKETISLPHHHKYSIPECFRTIKPNPCTLIGYFRGSNLKERNHFSSSSSQVQYTWMF